MLNYSRKFSLINLLLLAFIFASISPENIYSQRNSKVDARVTSVKGRATYSYKKVKNRRLRRGKILAEGYEVRTRKGGRVVVDLSDGSQVLILQNSRVVFGNYRKAGNLRELVRVTLGKIRVKINKFKNKPNPYRVKSPTASIAVRGTKFDVIVAANGETRVIVIEGLVEVISLKNPKDSLLAKPGQGVIVRTDFTLDFLLSNPITKNTENKDEQINSSNASQNSLIVRANSQAAADVYERFSETVTQTAENVTTSHFIALPDAHFDSLYNPAYAGSFNSPAGQFYFLSSVSNANIEDSNDIVQNSLNRLNPTDYSVALQGTFFTPIPKSQLVIGVSGSFVTNGLQGFSDDDVILPFDTSANLGTTNNKFFDGSIIVAQNFGSQDQTSIGFSYDRLKSNGNLNVDVDQSLENTRGLSAFSVKRHRITFGVKHTFGKADLGLFYRFGRNYFSIGRREGVFGKPPINSNHIKSKVNSSEIGFRFRKLISSRFFYGVEGAFVLERSRENINSLEEVDSMQRSKINRGSIGVGFGYFLRPKTILSIDVSGGLIKTERFKYQGTTENLLENNTERTRFISMHAAIQTDIWRNLFTSASLNTLAQNNTTNLRLLSDNFAQSANSFGGFNPNNRLHESISNTFSNFGVGWRFNKNYTTQYILTTDYGRTSLRHNFLFRYTFDFSKEYSN